LLANLKLNQQADLFLPADDSYITLAQHNNLLGLALPVAQMRPVLAVKKGNPQRVRSLDDLLAKDLRISMTDPDAAATGKLVRDAIVAVGKWDEFKSRVTVFKASVTEVAADLQVGAVDVGIVWDAMLTQLTDLEAVPLPELARSTARVVIAVTAASKQPHAAADFARYVAAADKGQPRFQAAGFASPAIAAPAEAAR
jgi:molybdate transport system substrate-binding protein